MGCRGEHDRPAFSRDSWRGRRDDDREHQDRDALAIADTLGMRPLSAHSRLGLGTLQRRAKRVESARRQISAAMEMFDSMEMKLGLSRAETALRSIGGL